MDIRTKDYRLIWYTDKLTEIHADLCRDEFLTIINGVGRRVLIRITDKLGDQYSLDLSGAEVLADFSVKTIQLSKC